MSDYTHYVSYAEQMAASARRAGGIEQRGLALAGSGQVYATLALAAAVKEVVERLDGILAQLEEGVMQADPGMFS